MTIKAGITCLALTELKKRIKNSEIVVYKDAGHGGIFQYHGEFVKSALKFFNNKYKLQTEIHR